MPEKFFNKLNYDLLDSELKHNLYASFIGCLRDFSEAKNEISVDNLDKIIDLYDLVLELNSKEDISSSLNTLKIAS